MSSSSSANVMFNHRGMPPQAGPPAPPSNVGGSRLTESFDIIRQEFDVMSNDLSRTRHQRDEYEAQVQSQVNEMNSIRNTVYELEVQHNRLRQQYEEEIVRLRAEVHATRSGQRPQLPPSAPPPESYYPPRDSRDSRRERERDPERERMHPPRERERPAPMHDVMMGDRDRDREPRVRDDRERDRERDREIRMRERDRDRDREHEQRDPKRFKPSRAEISPQHAHTQPPSAVTSPSFHTPSPFPYHNSASRTSHPPLPPPLQQAPAHAPHPPPRPSPSIAPPITSPLVPYSAMHFPPDDNLDLSAVPKEFKKEGSDWHVLYKPDVPRKFEISLMHTLTHLTVVCCVQFSADGNYVATGCNRTAQIYDSKSGDLTCTLPHGPEGSDVDQYIRGIRFSPDGKFLATGTEDKQIRIWDIETRTVVRMFSGHQQEIYALDFSADGKYLASGSGDRTVRIWDMTTPPSMTSATQTLVISQPVGMPDAGVTSVMFSPDGQYVAAGCLDWTVRLWDVRTGASVQVLKGHGDSVYSVAWTPDGTGMISGSLDKTMRYWDMTPLRDGRNVECLLVHKGHKDFVLSVALTSDGKWVLSGSKDRGVEVWNKDTKEVQCVLRGHKNSVIAIGANPTGNMFVTGSGDNLAKIWSYSLLPSSGS